ncbi:MAG: sensor histidine kinase, partial [Stellaceae bacterium]
MLLKSLSARLLILTVFFVMVGEVLIFVPSVARFRMTWFENRIAAGRLAILALEASPTGHLDQGLVNRLLARVGAHAVILHRPNGMVLMLDRPKMPPADRTIDLTHPSAWGAIRGSFGALVRSDDRMLRVRGHPPGDSSETVVVMLEEAPLRHEMWAFGVRILELSVVISLLAAALVYLSLQWLLVRPMRRITASMVEFREDPENASRVIVPSGRV